MLPKTQSGSYKRGIQTKRNLLPLDPNYQLSKNFTSGFSIGQELKKEDAMKRFRQREKVPTFNIVTHVCSEPQPQTVPFVPHKSDIIYNNDGVITSDFKTNAKSIRANNSSISLPPFRKDFESLGSSSLQNNPLFAGCGASEKSALLAQETKHFQDFVKQSNITIKLKENNVNKSFVPRDQPQRQSILGKRTAEERLFAVIDKN